MTAQDRDRFLSRLAAALRRLKVADAGEIVADVRGHIDESAEIRSLDETLLSLGAPEALARAYALELALSQRREGRWRASSVFLLVSLSVGASLVTLIVAPTLAALAFTFLVTGLLSFVFATIELTIVDLPFIENGNISPVEALGASAPIFAAGCLFGWLLWRYLRFVIASLRRAVPRSAGPA